MSEPFYFEDHAVGDEVNCGRYEVTKAEVIAFARQWDPQPWHVDEAAAEKSVFGGLTACSAHVFAIYCQTSQRWETGRVQQAIASLGFDNLRMHKPVFAGDSLRCVTRTHEARLSKSRPDCGIVIYDSRLINQHNDVVFSIHCSTLMARCPATD